MIEIGIPGYSSKSKYVLKKLCGIIRKHGNTEIIGGSVFRVASSRPQGRAQGMSRVVVGAQLKIMPKSMKPPSVTVPNSKSCPSLRNSITKGAQLKIIPKTIKSHQQRRPTPNHAQFYQIHSKTMPSSEPSPNLRSQFKTVPNSKSYLSQ